MQEFVVYSCYQFIQTDPADLDPLRSHIEQLCEKHHLMGTVLLAAEGGNFSLSGEIEHLDLFFAQLGKDTPFKIEHINKSFGDQRPYPRLKVKTQDSIITFLAEDDPGVAEITKGSRLTARELHELLQSDELVEVIDTRNKYESEWGTFKTAEVFDIDKFSQFPKAFKEKYPNKRDLEKKYVMFCTGGVRCEKAVIWAEKNGYKNVYQLDGGILSYLEQYKDKGHWEGGCFVFDRRWAVDPQLKEVHEEGNPHFIKQPKQYFDENFSSHFACD